MRKSSARRESRIVRKTAYWQAFTLFVLLFGGRTALAQKGKTKSPIPDSVTAQNCPIGGCNNYGSPPTVWFSHVISGRIYSNAAQTDTANWCDDTGLNQTSRSVTQNGASLSTTYTSGSHSGCTWYSFSVFTFTPALGTNTVNASINDNGGQQGFTSFVFTYDSSHVLVTPDGAAKTHPALTTVADTFTVQNLTGVSVTYNLSLTCSNSGTLNCSAPASTSVGANSSLPVIVSYHTRGLNSVDTVTLRATSADGHQTDPGSVIETASQYALSASFAANNEDNQKLSLCASDCFTAVSSHTTASYRTLGTDRSVTLTYHGDRTAVRPYVLADVSVPSGANVPTEVRLRATVNGALQTFVNGDTLLHFSTSGWQAGKTYRVAGQLDLSSFSTKMYPLVLTATAIYSDHNEPFTSPSSMKMMVVNLRTRSSILPTVGWTVQSVQQLYLQADSTALIVEGDGSGVYFSCNVYRSSCAPAGEYSKLSVSGTNYWRAYPDSTKVEFDGQGRMIEAIDRWGNTANFTYVSSGPATGFINQIFTPSAVSTAFQFVYDTVAKTITIQLPARGDGAPDNARRTIIGYNSGGHITSFTDADGISSSLGYDSQGRLSTLADRLGDTTMFYYHPSSWKLDSLALPAVPVDGQGPQRPTIRMNAWQRVGVPTTSTAGTFAASPMIDTIYGRTTGPVQDVTKFTADRWGQPLTLVDPLGNATTFVRTGPFATSVTNPLGQTDTYSYTNGFLTSETPYNQPITTISYDSWGMVSQISGGNGPTITRTFNASSRTMSNSVGGASVSTDSIDFRGRTFFSQDAGGHIQRVYFDPIFGNPDSTVSAAGQWTRSVQDGYGRDSAITALGHPAAERRIYDVLGRDSLTYDGVNASPVKYTYNALFLTALRDQKGQVYKKDVNALGWPTVMYDPADTVGWNIKTSYNYDVGGRVTSWKNRRDSLITQQWDKLGRLTSRRDGTGTADSLSYSANGQTIVASNAVSIDTLTLGNREGYTVVTQIPATGQWFRRAHSATAGVTSDTTVFTSSLGTLQSRINYWNQTRGVLDSLAVGASMYRIGYTNELLPDSLRYPIGFRIDSLTSTHRVYSRRYSASAIDTAFGRGYAYDSLGRITSESELSHTPGSTILRGYAYTGIGALQSYKGTLISPGFSYTGGFGCGYTDSTVQNTWLTYGYGYDPANNLVSQVDSLNGNTLTSGYFAVGNRDTLWNSVRYTYDRDGNRLSSGSTSYTWSATGKLLKVSSGGNTVEYAYNAFGELVRRKTNGTIDRYFLWDQGQLLLLLDGAGNRISEYAYLPNGEPLSYTRGALGSPTTYYFTSDLRGNVVGITDGNFQKQEINYAPWGDAENINGSFDRDSTRLGWKGHMWDGGISQIYYVHNRWYDPASRSFISEDPIGISGGLNTYAYAGNDGIQGWDPSGLNEAGLCQMSWIGAADGSYIEPGSFQIDTSGCPTGGSSILEDWALIHLLTPIIPRGVATVDVGMNHSGGSGSKPEVHKDERACSAARAIVANLGSNITTAGEAVSGAGAILVGASIISAVIAPEAFLAEESVAEGGVSAIEVGGKVTAFGAALQGYARAAGGGVVDGVVGFAEGYGIAKAKDAAFNSYADFFFPGTSGAAQGLIRHLVGKYLDQVIGALQGEEAACGSE